jgi:replication-associated recombination protein RarA
MISALRADAFIKRLVLPFARKPFTRPVRGLSSLQRPSILFVLGGPGSGKGTQAELLSKDYGLNHISVGDLLRKEMRSGSVESKIIKSVLDQGHIVPAHITVKLLVDDIVRQQSLHYVVDGKCLVGKGFVFMTIV